MPIKYGELTIIHNKEQNIFTTLLMWLTPEEHTEKTCKYIFLFDDGEICDSEDKFIDYNFKFCNSSVSTIPLYFEKTIKNKEQNKREIYFSKTPIEDNNNNRPSINSKQLFSSYSKYRVDISIPSIYNSIYYCYKDLSKPEIFGLIRIKSNDYMPRFMFAYDSDEFTKEEIVYIIHNIFNHASK